MCSLQHPNLVHLYGGVWNEGADKLCIVLEYCSNGSLSDPVGSEKCRTPTINISKSVWPKNAHKIIK